MIHTETVPRVLGRVCKRGGHEVSYLAEREDENLSAEFIVPAVGALKSTAEWQVRS